MWSDSASEPSRSPSESACDGSSDVDGALWESDSREGASALFTLRGVFSSFAASVGPGGCCASDGRGVVGVVASSIIRSGGDEMVLTGKNEEDISDGNAGLEFRAPAIGRERTMYWIDGGASPTTFGTQRPIYFPEQEVGEGLGEKTRCRSDDADYWTDLRNACQHENHTFGRK